MVTLVLFCSVFTAEGRVIPKYKQDMNIQGKIVPKYKYDVTSQGKMIPKYKHVMNAQEKTIPKYKQTGFMETIPKYVHDITKREHSLSKRESLIKNACLLLCFNDCSFYTGYDMKYCTTSCEKIGLDNFAPISNEFCFDLSRFR